MARYIPAEGILSDQAAWLQCNIHSVQFCVSAESISHSPAQGEGSRLMAAHQDTPVPGLHSPACVTHTQLDSLHQAVSGRCSRWKSLTLSPETTPRQHVAQRNTTQHVEIAVSGIRVFILQFPGQPGPWHRGKSWAELTQGKHSSFPGFWRWSQERTKWACLFFFFPSLAVLHEFSLYRYSERVFQRIFCTQKFQILSLLFFLIDHMHSWRANRIMISLIKVQHD